MQPESCEKILEYLLTQGFVTPKTPVCLYNWGEPFLNPYLEDILGLFRQTGLRCELSTNSSVVRTFQAKKAFSAVYNIKISMPGFSQASYDRAHGFDFEKIKENIRQNVHNVRSSGMQGSITAVAHQYRHNQTEMEDLQAFSRELDLVYSPIKAYMTSLDFLFDYAQARLDRAVLERAEQDIFLPPLAAFKQRPKGYVCPQWDILSLTWDGMLSLGCCCRSSRRDELAMRSIFELSPEESRTLRQPHPTCKTCIPLGVDYYLHNAGNL
jgi:organic radical activating enzyme